MKRLKSLLLLLAAIPLCGYTNCSYFSTVTVPAQDTTPPITGTRMWIDGVEHIDAWSSSNTSSTGDVVIAPFVFDSGGAKTLNVQESIQVYCHDNGSLGQITTIDFFPQSTSQSGGTGSSVSSGMYLMGSQAGLAGLGSYCNSGFHLISVTYGWSVTGTNFKNLVTTTVHDVVYTPSSSLKAGGMEYSAQAAAPKEVPEEVARVTDIDPATEPQDPAIPWSVRTELFPTR